MKKVKTTTWYVSKAYIFDCFKIMKAHIVDDDCNEYIATIKGDWIMRGYYTPKQLQIIDLEPYDRDEWHKLDDQFEYTHFLTKSA